MSAELLAELKKLQHQRSELSPFASHVEFHTWADKVLPLLAFDPKLQSRFRTMILATDSSRHLKITQQKIENINSAIGMLNQAITSLEVKPVGRPASNPAETEPVKPNKKSSISVVKIAESVIGGLVLACLVYLIWEHFGVQLK